MAVRLKNDALVVQGSDRWFVTDGLNAVGPVRRDLLVRGIEAGRVPLDSFVRHESWKVWRALADFAERSDESRAASPPELGKSPSPSGESVGVSSLESFESDNDQHEAAFADEESQDIAEETVEIMALLPSSRDLDEPMAFGFVPTEPHPRLPSGEQVVTQLSQDLLGGDRPTLASYLDDDEETNVPNKPGSIPLAPYRTSAPPPPAPPAPLASPPKVPRPGSIPPARGSETAKFTRSGSGKSVVRAAAPSSKKAAPSVAKAGVKSQRGTAARRSQTADKSTPLISSTRAATAAGSFPGAPISVEPRTISPQTMSPQTKASQPLIQDSETGDELQGATDLSEALLLLLNGLVRRTRSQVAILHRMADDGANAICAHGPNMVDFLGARTRLLDPAVVAAAGGHVVIAEPVAGSSGEATMQRLRKSGIDVEGAAMFPLRPKGRLMGFVELGKEGRFEMRELHEAERLIRVFVTRSEAGEFVR